MKTLTMALVCATLLTTTVQAYSSNFWKHSSVRPINNPIYSVNNYKQPNLATTPSRNNNESLVVQSWKPADTQWANYKNQMASTYWVSGIIVSSNTNLVSRNYKMPQLYNWQSTVSVPDYHVKKHHKHHNTTIGHS